LNAIGLFLEVDAQPLGYRLVHLGDQHLENARNKKRSTRFPEQTAS